MNELGWVVGEVMWFYKIELDDIVVIYDEFDLLFVKFWMKKGGGYGGYNGLCFILVYIGLEYWWLCLGIGYLGDKKFVFNYVFGDFVKVDQEWLELFFLEIVDQFVLLVDGKDSQFVNKLIFVFELEKVNCKVKFYVMVFVDKKKLKG